MKICLNEYMWFTDKNIQNLTCKNETLVDVTWIKNMLTKNFEFVLYFTDR